MDNEYLHVNVTRDGNIAIEIENVMPKPNGIYITSSSYVMDLETCEDLIQMLNKAIDIALGED